MKKYTKLFMFIIIILAIAMIAYSMEHKNHHVISVTNAIASSIIITEPVVIKEKMIKNDQIVPILVYHNFGPAPEKHKESKMQIHYRITATTFDTQMKYLFNNHYNPITFSTYVNDLLNNTPLPTKAIVLTFDDGWKNQYTYAYPILKKYNFVATFFIITSYPTGKYPAYMSWDDIVNLDKVGMEIGSHTVHHLNLTKISSQSLQNEITNSKTTLEQKLGHSITTFAYPEYGHNNIAELALKNDGYLGARAGYGAFINTVSHIFEINSQEVVNNPNPFLKTIIPDTTTSN